MNERIKKIRLDYNLTQKQMSEKIGVTEATVSRMESGKSAITEQTIKTLCREFDVNKDWFVTGEGDMYIVPEQDEKLIEAIIKIQKSGNEKLKEIVEKMVKLDEKYIDLILTMIDTVQSK